MSLTSIQEICKLNGHTLLVPEGWTKLGIAFSTLGQMPINGLRIPAEGNTNGWYLWCGGEPSKAEDFYSPLHVEHIDRHLPQVREYLVLPPGYRFLIDDSGHQDVWFDEALLG
ncbi:hypothetical protein [Rhodoferax sp. GW822-FHT02A01]|uniref:immunity protein Imm33 domain-containing protein n=1 Tax=Rhodoferax sp. GW822-FHT02A01 TaxID=3141537 RepID=UPI00315CD407